MGGGGKGGGGSGVAEMQQQEQQRQARIQAATKKINETFANAGRAALYDKQRENVLNMNRDKIQEGFQNAARQLRFNMARNGLFGGSYDVDQNKALQRRNDEGLMQAAQLADDAAEQLRAQDENARASLINLAQSGIDSTDAAQQAAAKLQANAAGMHAAGRNQIVGDIFSGLNSAYLGYERGQGRRQVLDKFQGMNDANATYGGDT